MNTGLHDVWNLVWKLDLFLRGRGNELLLESYGAERGPVIRHVIETTDILTRILGTRNRLAQALRNAAIPVLSRSATFRRSFVRRLSELGIDYHGSPIVEGAGARYFDDSMRGGGIRSRFLLLKGEAERSVREAAERLAASFGDVVELRRGRAAGLTLVRPDGYIAYSARDGDGIAALESARSILELQTH